MKTLRRTLFLEFLLWWEEKKSQLSLVTRTQWSCSLTLERLCLLRVKVSVEVHLLGIFLNPVIIRYGKENNETFKWCNTEICHILSPDFNLFPSLVPQLFSVNHNQKVTLKKTKANLAVHRPAATDAGSLFGDEMSVWPGIQTVNSNSGRKPKVLQHCGNGPSRQEG